MFSKTISLLPSPILLAADQLLQTYTIAAVRDKNHYRFGLISHDQETPENTHYCLLSFQAWPADSLVEAKYFVPEICGTGRKYWSAALFYLLTSYTAAKSGLTSGRIQLECKPEVFSEFYSKLRPYQFIGPMNKPSSYDTYIGKYTNVGLDALALSSIKSW